MLTREQIEQLEAFDGQEARVLSAYLDLEPSRQPRHSYRIVLEDLVKEAGKGLDESTRRDLVNEATRVQAWLENEKVHGKGLAVFSCAARGLWQTHFLPVPLEDHLAFDPQPDIAPLLTVMDEYERYAIALVDKEKARLFTVFLGAIEETEAFQDDVPGKHPEGGVSQSHYLHHHEVHVLWHLKRVVQRLAELEHSRHFDRLILAGPAKATNELRQLLPSTLAQRVVAVIPAEISADTREILDLTLQVESLFEREVEEQLLQELFEEAGAGGRATRGLPETLDALYLDKVQTLVVADGARANGSECRNCGRLEPGTLASCPACGHPMHPVHDLYHRAMARTIEQAGSVEVVHGDAAHRLLATASGLGAVLRFR